jgi:hypothetical protein
MGVISKNVLENGEWCAPTRELKNSKLLKLVHQTRKIITDTGRADAVEVTPQDDVVLLVNRKPEVEHTAPIAPMLADGSRASYPVYRDKLRPVRLAVAVIVPLTAIAAAVSFVLLR